MSLGPIAHGGHCVARVDRRVIFVRHGLPGEVVDIALTDTSRDRLWRGDVIRVHIPAAGRVRPACEISGPGGCGGCDFQHADLATQRELKAAVVAEQLARLAGIQRKVVVKGLTSHTDGFGWRTRMQYHSSDDGRLGLRQARNHKVVELPAAGCLLAAHPLELNGWPARARVQVAGDSILVNGELFAGSQVLTEHAADRAYQVQAAGFWQVHPAAADTLVGAVIDLLVPKPGERALDLYCGVGLFAGALADAGCAVFGMEQSSAAVRLATANVPTGQFVAGNVARALDRLPAADLVVCDPPRAGAGRAVVQRLVALGPRAIAYVACDPAALARDLGYFAEEGYQLGELRAFDLFPMTHHVECVAVVGKPEI